MASWTYAQQLQYASDLRVQLRIPGRDWRNPSPGNPIGLSLEEVLALSRVTTYHYYYDAFLFALQCLGGKGTVLEIEEIVFYHFPGLRAQLNPRDANSNMRKNPKGLVKKEGNEWCLTSDGVRRAVRLCQELIIIWGNTPETSLCLFHFMFYTRDTAVPMGPILRDHSAKSDFVASALSAVRSAQPLPIPGGNPLGLTKAEVTALGSPWRDGRPAIVLAMYFLNKHCTYTEVKLFCERVFPSTKFPYFFTRHHWIKNWWTESEGEPYDLGATKILNEAGRIKALDILRTPIVDSSGMCHSIFEYMYVAEVGDEDEGPSNRGPSGAVGFTPDVVEGARLLMAVSRGPKLQRTSVIRFAGPSSAPSPPS